VTNKSKNKGKGFERQVAALCSQCWGGHWQRVPSSGAIAGGINAKILERAGAKFARLMSGDIIVPEEFEGMEIECKCRAAFNFMHLLRSEQNKELNAWIDQTWQHAPRVGLLFFKANNTPIFVCHRLPEIVPALISSVCIYHYSGLTYYIHEASEAWMREIKSLLLRRLALSNLEEEIVKHGLSDSDCADEGDSDLQAPISG
jgi:hypothetical protein